MEKLATFEIMQAYFKFMGMTKSEDPQDFHWYFLFDKDNAEAERRVMTDLEAFGSPYVCVTRNDLRYAAMTGVLPLAFGMVGIAGEDDHDACTEIGDRLTDWLHDDGFFVRWSGNPSEKVLVAVESGSFRLITEALDEREALTSPPPTGAEIVADTDTFIARVWFDGTQWKFDLYDIHGKQSIERGGGSTRNNVEEYVRERLEFYADMN